MAWSPRPHQPRRSVRFVRGAPPSRTARLNGGRCGRTHSAGRRCQCWNSGGRLRGCRHQFSTSTSFPLATCRSERLRPAPSATPSPTPALGRRSNRQVARGNGARWPIALAGGAAIRRWPEENWYWRKTGQRKRRDMKQNRIMPRNYNTPVFSRLDEIASIEFNTGFPLYCQQFYCMFIKRALFSLRNWKLMLLQISVIVVVTAYLLTTQNLLSEVPIREIDLSQYGRTVVPYSVSGESDLAMNFIKNLKIFLMFKNQEFHEAQDEYAN
ncbi:hypothetical protein QTO34_013137 [Cnephaeus nilssonii]|uniref:Uncharacterized protein n=1 Tax=Cnephaeus nilssonii TaxID=3371016 RepID=A0AA40LUM2_CNENI|nr:hypothetical protein QTO34_013137 [Eptesicus nilssonii]